MTALRSAASQVFELALAATSRLGADLSLEAVIIHLQAWDTALALSVVIGEDEPTPTTL